LMKIVLYGATGMIGQRILREALQRGHEVTAIAHDPSSLAPQANAHLRVETGDILDANSVAAAVAGYDAVISAFGPRGDAMGTLATAAHALIDGLTRARVRRLLVVGGAGSLEVAPGVMLMNSPGFPDAWRGIAEAHTAALEVYKSEGGALEWSYLSPAALIEPGERTGVFRRGGDQLLTDAEGNSRISAEDFAVALLDELETPQHVRQRFTVSY
jgi:putative NADH-flavin reductase